jgi:hypothetical protein|tara:strand:- start:267 stop:488 length:222 start_codon:yes stop_codon:yes gene_type:complete
MHRKIPNYPESSWLKTLRILWVNTRSLIYTSLTVGGILVVLLSSLLLLPVVIIIVLAGAIFMAYKIMISDYER